MLKSRDLRSCEGPVRFNSCRHHARTMLTPSDPNFKYAFGFRTAAVRTEVSDTSVERRLWTIYVRTLSEVTRRSELEHDVTSPSASLSIEPFQGSRWRLRRTRLVCILNGVLVLSYPPAEEPESWLGRKRRNIRMILLPTPVARQSYLPARTQAWPLAYAKRPPRQRLT